MSKSLRGMGSVLGRVMIAAIFVLSAAGNKIPNFAGVAGYMASEGVPAPKALLGGAIAFLLVGGASVIAGYKARIGAGLLLAFLALATYFFHDFWTFTGKDREMQTIQFMKNLSLMGTMAFLMANGSGAMSLDAVADNKSFKGEKI